MTPASARSRARMPQAPVKVVRLAEADLESESDDSSDDRFSQSASSSSPVKNRKSVPLPSGRFGDESDE